MIRSLPVVARGLRAVCLRSQHSALSTQHSALSTRTGLGAERLRAVGLSAGGLWSRGAEVFKPQGRWLSVDLPGRTDAETEEYYDKQKEIYQKVWDDEGRICWGYFKHEKSTFKEAGLYHVERMTAMANITQDSVVLDVGCGLGINSFWLANTFGCKVVGIDISSEMISHCEQLRDKHPKKDSISFIKGTADEKEAELKALGITHMFSTGTIYQIHLKEREKLYKQIAAVMKPGGVLVFDDAFCPNGEVKDLASKEAVYDRLHLEKLWDEAGYKQVLQEAGFKIEVFENISSHQARSYAHLATAAKTHGFEKLGSDYDISVKSINDGDFGWCLVVAKLA